MKRFERKKECDAAFDELKNYIGKAPILSKPNLDENLILYLAISEVAVSLVLEREEGQQQIQLYYIPRTENWFADALSKFTSLSDAELFKTVHVKLLPSPSISEKACKTLWVEGVTHWIQEIVDYLNEQKLSTEKDEARKIRLKSARCVLIDKYNPWNILRRKN
ncbi:Retrovirus-related Pol polyprotein from transposon 17.6 [Abeliophyllum distichum]|uniref:Retrovirus-related Pol polyprotein from transposon 17.6 n=1 Tax=Abeliophyllum distichum TaxID=126358 RepID=A0ABD1SEH4_9LAMI